MFLDADALYLLCFNVAAALTSPSALVSTIEYLEEWADLIGSRAGNARVLLVGTQVGSLKHDDPKLKPLKRALDAFISRCARRPPASSPRISHCFLTNALGTLSGIDELRVACAEASTSLLADRPAVPLGYVQLREDIQKIARVTPICSVTRFGHMLCDTGSVVVFSDPKKTVRLLHSWGWVCYFGDSPALHDTVFLSPQWLSKMLAGVATRLHLAEDRSYFLYRDELAEAWKNEPEENIDALIAAMHAFDLLFHVDPGCDGYLRDDLIDEVARENGLSSQVAQDNVYVVPGLLPDAEPRDVAQIHERLLIGEKRRRRSSTIPGGGSSSYSSSDSGSNPSTTGSDTGSGVFDSSLSGTSDSQLLDKMPETISRRYDFSVLPPGFLSRLIVRYFASEKFSILGAWRSGLAVQCVNGLGVCVITREDSSRRALHTLSETPECANLVEAELLALRSDLCPKVAVVSCCAQCLCAFPCLPMLHFLCFSRPSFSCSIVPPCSWPLLSAKAVTECLRVVASLTLARLKSSSNRTSCSGAVPMAKFTYAPQSQKRLSSRLGISMP
jgi:C-terminal of Roc, COR, domain